MKSLITLLAVASLGLGLSACGGSVTSPGASPSSTAAAAVTHGPATATLPQIELLGDDDMDSDRYPHEVDDESEAFGHPADVTDTREVTALVGRYYAATARDDGASACRLLYSVLVESVPEDYGQAAGLRGATCAAVLSKLFKGVHEHAALRVRAVRVDLDRGVAMLGFAGVGDARYIMVHRERGAWRIDMLVAATQPIGVE
jgi:hypothetical protein